MNYLRIYKRRVVIPVAMLASLLLSAAMVFAVAPFDATLDWTRVFQGLSAGTGLDVAQDRNGNIYVTGEFANANFDFDDAVAGKQNPGAIGQNDIFVAKISADGTFAWARAMGSENIDQGSGIAVDVNGSAYTIGSFRQVAEMNPSGVISMTDASDPANLLNPLVTVGDYDVFISKLDAAGNYLWSLGFGGTGPDSGSDIALDSAANVYAVGTFNGAVDFNPDPNASVDIVSQNSDVFVTSFDSSGNHKWAKHIDGPSSDQGRGIATDSLDNIYVTGYVQGADVNFDPGSADAIVNSIRHDLFLIKYNTAGDFRWVRHVPSMDSDFGNAVAVDSTDTIYITGSYKASADFNPDPAIAEEITSNGGGDVFVAAYGSDGSFKWVRGFGGPNDDEGHDIATDSANNVYITGQFQGTVDFDPSAATSELTSAGGTDAFILKLDSNGIFVSVTQLGGADDDAGHGLVADADGKVSVTGAFQNIVDFDPDIAATLAITSVGQSDIFVTKNELLGVAATATPVPTTVPPTAVPPTAVPETEPTAVPETEPTAVPETEPTAVPPPDPTTLTKSVYLPYVNQ